MRIGREVSDAKIIKEKAPEKFEGIKDGKPPTKTVGKRNYAPNERGQETYLNPMCSLVVHLHLLMFISI